MPIHQSMNAAEIMLQAERYTQHIITQMEFERSSSNAHRVAVRVDIESNTVLYSYNIKLVARSLDYNCVEISAAMLQVERYYMPSPDVLNYKIRNLYEHMDAKINDHLANEQQADIDRRIREAMNYYNGSHYSTSPVEPITVAPVDYHISETERIIQQLREIDQRQQMRDMMRQNFSPFSRGRIDDPPPTLDVTPCSGEEMWKYHKRKDDKNAGTPKPKPSIWRRFAMQNLRERRYMQMARRMQSVVDKLEEESKRELPGDVELDMLEI